MHGMLEPLAAPHGPMLPMPACRSGPRPPPHSPRILGAVQSGESGLGLLSGQGDMPMRVARDLALLTSSLVRAGSGAWPLEMEPQASISSGTASMGRSAEDPAI